MSEIKANAAVCEICGGKLVFRNADNFECESCGANYPKDWVRAKVQEQYKGQRFGTVILQ